MTSPDLVIADAEVDGAITDVAVTDGRISAVAPDLGATENRIDAGGAALLPGLHDHHLHPLALAARSSSIDCEPRVRDESALANALRVPGEGWLRVVGYHESIAGDLDRHRLDAITGDRPVRVQHTSGALWILNSAALARVRLDDSGDVERDRDGRPTGRLWRYDDRLRAQLDSTPPDLSELSEALLRHGITSLTDATPELDARALEALARMPQSVLALGAPYGLDLPGRITAGPAKLHLRDHDLPDLADLATLVAAHHRRQRPVAVHCVSAESLLVTLAAIEQVGAVPGDRIEHAAVVPPTEAARIAALGLAVVTQPDFLRSRGDRYLREMTAPEIDWLYPHASLLAAGARVAVSSDAPVGSVGPWRVIASAASRRTASGTVIGPAERVPAAVALAGYLSGAHAPGGASRRVEVGAPADLCLLHTRLDRALADPESVQVVATVVDGRAHTF